MRYLLKQIKATLQSAIPSIASRIFMSVVAESIKLSDGPYCRVVYVGQVDTEYGFSDTIGFDKTTLQFSVFAESLVSADTLVDSIITALNGVTLTLDAGSKAIGNKKQRGILVEPKSPDANQTYHCWVTVEYIHQDSLS